MIKTMEWIGTLIALLCLMVLISNPLHSMEEIRRGPAPNLRQFTDRLQR